MATAAAVLGGLTLALSQWLIYIYAPVETSMGIIQKIFYMHLPLAIWALISFFMVFIGSIVYLRGKKAAWDNFCRACAETGVLFASLGLITGIIWAKKSWGVWWTWDPRLSTTLVMWFIYCAYLSIGSLDLRPGRAPLIRAVLGIVAFLDVPLVFLSARIFRSIHPAVFASRDGGLEWEMKITALICVLGLGFIWAALVQIRKKQLDAENAVEKILFSPGPGSRSKNYGCN